MARGRIAFSVAGGDGEVLVETNDIQPGQGQVSRSGEITVQAGQAIQEAFAGIRPVAEAVMASLGKLSLKPDEVEAEFGVKLTAETGVILAKAAAEGHVVIKLIWRPQLAEEQAAPQSYIGQTPRVS
jgi:hypothetical protein